MNLKSILVFSLTALIISCASLMVYHNFFNSGKVGYVKSGVLLQEYKELKLAEEQFGKEMKIVEGNIDTLKQRFQRLEAIYSNSKNESEKNALAMKLGSMKYEYENYSEQSSMQMEQQKQEIMKKILANINNYIQEYGKKNNYRFIFGTTNEGSILYGNEQDDLTTEIITELNKKYQNEGEIKK